MLKDLRKTALIAGIAMALSALWTPLPILLLLLYRTRVTPAISKNLRLLAKLLIVIRAASLSFAVWDVWHTGIQPLPKYSVLPASLASSFYVGPPGQWISDVVSLVSRVAFLLFFIALARQAPIASNTDPVAMRRVRKAALAAVIAGALFMVLDYVSYQVYAHALRTYGHKEASILPTLRQLLFALPALIAPWIIYTGVRANSQTPGSQLLHT